MDQQEILTEKIQNVYPEGASSTSFFNIMKIIVIIVIVLIFLFFILRYLAISTKSGKKMNEYVKNSILNFYGDNEELVKKMALLEKQKAAQLEIAKKNSNLNKLKTSIQSEVESKRPTRKQLQDDITTTSSIQKRNKPAYCYVGSDRGYRSCVEVDPNDECMSKKIFPTREVCINPTLRV